MENNIWPLLFPSTFKAKCAVGVVELLFLGILVGSIDFFVGLVVSVCAVLIRIGIWKWIAATKERWKFPLIWASGLGAIFILVFASLTIMFECLGGKIFIQVSGLCEIAVIAGVLTGGVALMNLLTIVVIKLLGMSRK